MTLWVKTFNFKEGENYACAQERAYHTRRKPASNLGVVSPKPSSTRRISSVSAYTDPRCYTGRHGRNHARRAGTVCGSGLGRMHYHAQRLSQWLLHA